MIVLFQHILYMNYFHTFILTLVLVISIIIYQKIKNRRQITLATKIPGPNGYFIIGSIPILNQGPEKLLEKLKIMCKKYEYSIFKFWVFHKLVVMVSKAGDIEKVMNSSNCFKKTIFHSVIQDTFSIEGLVTTNNAHNYKKNRKIISEWLKYSNLKLWIPSFYEESKVLEHIISKKSESISFECDITRIFELASMDTIGRTALGEEFNSQKIENHTFLNNYEHLSEICGYKFMRPWFFISSLFSLSSKKHQQLISQHLISEYINDLIKKKRVELKEKTKTAINGNYDPDSACQKRKPLIEFLLENDHQMSCKQIQDELTTIICAGHDLTALTNSLVIFMLAHHQDVQQNVYREINSIFSEGDPNRPPTYDDLQKMEYLERVIKETMRLYPAAPIVLRQVESEMMIGKYLIPADTIIGIPIYCLHLNPQYYKDPEKFSPDNFLPDVCRSRHPFAYIPFSAGFRNCVGMKYAMLQLKTTISTLVRSYRFSPSEKCLTPKDLRLSFNIVLKFVDGCYVKIEPRT